MATSEYPPHELALLIPPMGETDYCALRDSIADQGLQRAITLYEGKVLDGLHRQRAVLELGVRLRTEEYTGGDPLGFVVAANVARRQLNTTERAKLGARILIRLPDGRAGRSPRKRGDRDRPKSVAEGVARQVGCGTSSIQQAVRLLREAPELFDETDGRKLKLGAAYRRFESRSTRRKSDPADVLSLDEKRAQRHVRHVAAWRRVLDVNGAALRMWKERETVFEAIEQARDQRAVEALAGQVSHTICQLRAVADAALERLDSEQRARVDALLRARGWPVGAEQARRGE